MTTTAPSTELESFYSRVEALNMRPLWLQRGLGAAPAPRVKPMLWRWDDIYGCMIRAGELMPVGSEDAERRVLTLQNPSIPGGRGSTQTLQAAVQMIGGGEAAPSHRHTIAAIRFIIEGSGARTIVDGEPLVMEPGDFLLTPNWTWHGHSKETDGAMFWLDVLDAPLVGGQNWTFYEEYPDGGLQPAEKKNDDSLRRLGMPGLRPTTHISNGRAYSPLLTYKWADARSAVERLTDDELSPCDGASIRYVNPVTGGPIMPTMDASLQLIRAGQQTQTHRHTSSAIYFVAEGSGKSVIGGETFTWGKNDVFSIPTWTAHCHEASGGADAVLFSISDQPVLDALELYREEHVES
jgi:gentisate 1,2-dioxygenase